jgi:plasminogen activator inhibitor 1 RNA-binding protein
MSVATKNPFAVLDAEDNSRPSSPAPKASATPAAAPSARGTQKPRGGPASRGGKYYARGGKPAPKDGPQNTEDPTDLPPRKFEGRGRGRGARGGAQRGGRRPFDRHSQTGKTDSDKKIHQSWGGDDGNQELKAEEAADKDAAAEGANNEWGAAAADANEWAIPADTSGDAAPAEGDKPEGRPRREREQREPEEEDNTLTLDQYLAKKAEKELDIVPKLEARKANEGDDSIWSDAVAISKNEEEEAYFVGKAKSAPKARAKKEEKVYLEIDARFERNDRSGRGRGRGDRGGDRGGDRARARGGARGSGRGGRQSNPSTPLVDVDDQNAFPSLS